jgi:hypothetical protein
MMPDETDPCVMDYNTFLGKYAPDTSHAPIVRRVSDELVPATDMTEKQEPIKHNIMTTERFVFENAETKKQLVDMMAEMIIAIVDDLKCKQREMADKIKVNQAYISFVKTKSYSLLSDTVVKDMAVSFMIKTDTFDWREFANESDTSELAGMIYEDSLLKMIEKKGGFHEEIQNASQPAEIKDPEANGMNEHSPENITQSPLKTLAEMEDLNSTETIDSPDIKRIKDRKFSFKDNVEKIEKPAEQHKIIDLTLRKKLLQAEIRELETRIDDANTELDAITTLLKIYKE